MTQPKHEKEQAVKKDAKAEKRARAKLEHKGTVAARGERTPEEVSASERAKQCKPNAKKDKQDKKCQQSPEENAAAELKKLNEKRDKEAAALAKQKEKKDASEALKVEQNRKKLEVARIKDAEKLDKSGVEG